MSLLRDNESPGQAFDSGCISFSHFFLPAIGHNGESEEDTCCCQVEPLVRLSSSLREVWMTDSIVAVKAQLGPGMEGHLDFCLFYFDRPSISLRGCQCLSDFVPSDKHIIEDKQDMSLIS